MFKIFSVDDHIVEPADVWSSRVPAKFRDTAPHVIEEDGREFWVYEDQRNMTMGLNAVAGKPRDQWNMEPARYSDMIPGCYDPKERAQDMLTQGVLASVNFPTLPRFGGMLFNSFKDKELADLCVKAWNDFVLEEWCPGGPEGFFVPMVICQVWDPKLAAAEIERCVAKGAKSLCFTENPTQEGLPSFHDKEGHWDPIWRACVEADIPISLHIGSSGFMPVIDPSAPFTGIIASAEVACQLSLVNLATSPVPVNFPDIKFVWSEGGIGWVPALLHRADRQLDRHSGWAGTAEIKPSEVFARNMWCCMVEEPRALKHYDEIGADKIVCETDYPHADTTYPHTQKSFAEIFDGVPDDVVEQISHGNAERVFNWKMADESLLTSPDVQSWRTSLAEDPFAAMSRRHDIAGIEHLEAVDDGLCNEMVNTGAIMVRCKEPIGADGTCTNGHQAA